MFRLLALGILNSLKREMDLGSSVPGPRRLRGCASGGRPGGSCPSRASAPRRPRGSRVDEDSAARRSAWETVSAGAPGRASPGRRVQERASRPAGDWLLGLAKVPRGRPATPPWASYLGGRQRQAPGRKGRPPRGHTSTVLPLPAGRFPRGTWSRWKARSARVEDGVGGEPDFRAVRESAGPQGSTSQSRAAALRYLNWLRLSALQSWRMTALATFLGASERGEADPLDFMEACLKNLHELPGLQVDRVKVCIPQDLYVEAFIFNMTVFADR
nr:uncharacterized protein LOC108391450 isoform X4 [Manis javanica]